MKSSNHTWCGCLVCRLTTMLTIDRTNLSMCRKHRHIAGTSGRLGTQKSPHRQDCMFHSNDTTLVIKWSTRQVYSQCFASADIRVSLQPGIAAVHGHGHLDLAPTPPHTSPCVSSAKSATSASRTESRSTRVIHISNSLVLWISVLYRGSQSCVRPADDHTRNATPACACNGGTSHFPVLSNVSRL